VSRAADYAAAQLGFIARACEKIERHLETIASRHDNSCAPGNIIQRGVADVAHNRVAKFGTPALGEATNRSLAQDQGEANAPLKAEGWPAERD
jgi:hypothetical protein